MTGEIVSVGTELLLGQIVDTHAATMARIFAECGISSTRRTTVGDNLDRIVRVLKEALARTDLVVTIGGLGPTLDDLTRDAIAVAMEDELQTVPEMEEKLRKFFAYRKLPWSDSIARQAQKPQCGRFVENPNGTAPGLICEKHGKKIVALPGPKGEFGPMAEGPVKEYLSGLGGDQVIHSRVVRICGMGESHVEELVRDLLGSVNPTIAPYAHPGEVHLRLTAKAATKSEADLLIEPLEAEIRLRLAEAVFGVGTTTLEESILSLLKHRHETLATVESMTGGELAGRFTSAPGASEVFLGGLVPYTPKLKMMLLQMTEEALMTVGPVSDEIARRMAEAGKAYTGATYGLSITGNAGPTSDVDQKPVGLCYIACSGPAGTVAEEYRFRGTRGDIRRRGAQAALVLLRHQVLRP